MKIINLFTILMLTFAIMSCNQQAKTGSEASGDVEEPVMNALTQEEVEEGWILLFDGKTTTGWKNFNEDEVSGWLVEDGCLLGLGLGGDIGGDIVSVDEYSNFILKWDWKLGPHGNSGVMYHVLEGEKYKAPY